MPSALAAAAQPKEASPACGHSPLALGVLCQRRWTLPTPLLVLAWGSVLLTQGHSHSCAPALPLWIPYA